MICYTASSIEPLKRTTKIILFLEIMNVISMNCCLLKPIHWFDI